MNNISSGLYKKIKNNNIDIKDIIIYSVLVILLTSILKLYIGPLNVIVTAFCFFCFFVFYLKNKIKKYEVFLIIYIIFTLIQNFFIWGFDYYESNMLIYFPFLILYFCIFQRISGDVVAFLFNNKKFIDALLIIWNGIVFITFFIPSCYLTGVENSGFVSIAGTSFLLSPLAIFDFVLLMIQYRFYKRKIYAFALIIPSLCVLLGATRTYLVVLMCAWLVFVYINTKSRKRFISCS